MKAFEISPEGQAEIAAVLDQLFAVCTKHNAPCIAGVLLKASKTMTDDGINIQTDIHSTRVLHMGRDRVPDRFIAATKFIEDDQDDAISFVAQMAQMYGKYGALMNEDNPKAACDTFALTGDIEAARRAGGSLPPLEEQPTT